MKVCKIDYLCLKCMSPIFLQDRGIYLKKLNLKSVNVYGLFVLNGLLFVERCFSHPNFSNLQFLLTIIKQCKVSRHSRTCEAFASKLRKIS